MTSAASCPYCNAELPPLPAVAPSLRVPCPRCGEPVPRERFPVLQGVAAGCGPDLPKPAAVLRTPEGKRMTARVVLSIMAGMAALALVFALLTQKMRRDNDFRGSGVNPPRPVATDLPPAQLPGLAFLPTGTNVVAGLHVTSLNQDPAGRALLRGPRPEPVEGILSTLEAVGLGLEDVDHVVFGCELKEVLPAFTTVIVTRNPYDPGQVAKAVQRHPVSATTFRGKPLYRFTDVRQVPKIWCAEPRVLVYTTLKTENLDHIPTAVKEPADPLSPRARKALTGRLSAQSRAWAVGDLEPAKGLTDLVQQFGVLPKAQARLLGLVRAFAVGIATQEEGKLTLVGDFYTGQPDATAELRKDLEGVTLQGAKAKVEAPPADVKDAEAQWVSWQVRADTDSVRDALGKLALFPGKGKASPP
jgi:hypothetical protein